MAGVGHQHAIAASKAQIGGERGALVAALLLDDLDQQHLAALDDVLNLVAAAQVLALAAKFIGGAFVNRRGVRTGAGLGRFGIFVAMVAVVGLVGAVVGAVVVMMGVETAVFIFAAEPLFLGGMFGFLTKQCIAIRLGDLVIIGVDFAEREKAVAIAAVIDERRLERRFDPRNLG